MCKTCWEEHGSPKRLTSEGKQLAEQAKHMDAYGAFHIVIEDYNITDGDLEFCINHPDAKPADIRWGKRMLALTVPERAAVVGKCYGFF